MDYVRAAQPRVVTLFLLTVLVAMLLAHERSVALILAVLVGVGLTVAGAATLNNVLERDLDRRMERTRERPTASGALPPGRALAAGLGAVAAGVAELWVAAGWPAATLAFAGAAYYVVVYTMLLKPRLALSALPGGLAGAFPPLIGWAAAGAHASRDIVYLCALVIVWSPAHFWALSYSRRGDYENAGIPTPAVTYGERAGRAHVVAFLGLVTCLTLVPAATRLYGPAYLAIALGAAVAMWIVALRFAARGTAASAWWVYKVSGPYLAVIMAAMLLDRLL
jgi:heme o synthase